MAKIKRVRFTVEGSGQFPYDMLRYDHCWPASEANDSDKLSPDWGGEKRQVTLLSDSPNAPTEGRWNSFTWKVLRSERLP